MVKRQPILHLDSSLRIGRGGVREVFQHPEDPGRCVKIVHDPRRWRSVNRECRYLRRYHRQGKPFTRMTRFFGWCPTNLGPGALFTLVRDHDGHCSRSLASSLPGAPADSCRRQLQPLAIVELLSELHQHLLRHRIIVSDPALHNLVVHYPEPAKARLVIIDGIGNSSFIKMADWFGYWARRDINRKWRRYIEVSPLLQGVFAAAGRTTMNRG